MLSQRYSVILVWSFTTNIILKKTLHFKINYKMHNSSILQGLYLMVCCDVLQKDGI